MYVRGESVGTISIVIVDVDQVWRYGRSRMLLIQLFDNYRMLNSTMIQVYIEI